MSPQRPPGGELTPWVILTVFAAGLLVETAVWLGGSLGALAAGAGWHPPSFSVATLFTIVRDGPGPLWPGVATGWIWSGIIATSGTLAAPGTAIATRAWRNRPGLPGLARKADLTTLTMKDLATRTRRLRPSLADTAHIEPDSAGIFLGTHRPSGTELRASMEDVCVAFMAPRSGKSTALAVPAILRAPGPVLLTSNKSDVYAVTRKARADKGEIFGFDPQRIAFLPQDFWWDMIAEGATVEGARHLSSSFISTAVDATNRKDFWFSAASNVLTALFHAAARGGRVIDDFLDWVARPADRTPVEILRETNRVALSRQLESTIEGAPDTRDGIYETARQCITSLLDPELAAWVTPSPGKREFRPRDFVKSSDTLYLLSKDGGGSAAGLITAAADAVFRAGILEAEIQGGRIDPPLLPILDEAANICRIEDLPAYFSHLGSRGLPIITILQSYSQGVTVWGEAGMDTLWSAATVKVLGAGLDDADFLEKISRLIGDHKAPEVTHSYSSGGRSTSVTYRRERTMQASEIRALSKGWSILLATGIRPALIELDPWYESARAAELSRALADEVQGITVRAVEADDQR